jgi:hypothetical protein
VDTIIFNGIALGGKDGRIIARLLSSSGTNSQLALDDQNKTNKMS